MTDDGLLPYYAERADEYERIYDIEWVQSDYDAIDAVIADRFDDRRVLEVACGTGYWTRRLEAVAESVVGVDANAPVLARARRTSESLSAHFLQADAYTLDCLAVSFTAGLAGFWLSHVPRERLQSFIDGFHDRLESGAPVCLFDSRDVRDVSDVVREDDAGNTYERRELEDGTEHTILKNYLTEDEITGALPASASEIDFRELDGLWCLTYRVA